MKKNNYPVVWRVSLMATALIAVACTTKRTTNTQKPTAPNQSQILPINQTYTNEAEQEGVHLSNRPPVNNVAQSVSDYYLYDSVLSAAKNGNNDALVRDFLARQSYSAMGESVRNEWVSTLAKRGDTQQFLQQYRYLPPEARSKEAKCYAQLFQFENNADLLKEVLNTAKQPNGCNQWLQSLASQGKLNPQQAWRRVRGLISNGHTSDATALATALGNPMQESALTNIISPSAQKNLSVAASRLNSMASALNAQQIGFAWGVLGLAQAKNQNFDTALSHYQQADRSQLNDEQFEWYARSALRRSHWQLLANIIESMPTALREKPDWQYWLGRSYRALGKSAQAPLQKASQSGRNFYAVLATEELGRRVQTQNNVAPARPADVQLIAKDGAIQRALAIFQASQANGDWKMRRQAQNEWRYATRGMNEATMLAAAQLAYERQFYEMAVNTAERTDKLLNYQLRYISPYQSTVRHYASQVGIDPAWVFGLIRQESRFIMGAKSSAGAQGLMQVMPATARVIANKIGMDSSQLYSTEGNIRMGTWYMADGKNNLQGSEVLATAGYNAGPGRARKWQASFPLEGAIYAETIPFNETRDYVKKVMTNATYYASLFGQGNTSLKQRMGSIPAGFY